MDDSTVTDQAGCCRRKPYSCGAPGEYDNQIPRWRELSGHLPDPCRPSWKFCQVVDRTIDVFVKVLDKEGLCTFPIDDEGGLKKIAAGYELSTKWVAKGFIGSLDG